MNDILGTAMKGFEHRSDSETHPLSAHNHVYMRLDGRSFHTYTRGRDRPYDYALRQAMIAATLRTCDEFNPDIAYVQSDEISLGWFPKDNPLSQFPFGGKRRKLLSVIPAFFTAAFIIKDTERSAKSVPCFDSRIVDFGGDRANFQKMFYWRYVDAKKNAIQMAAHHHFSQKALHGVNTGEMATMLADIGHPMESLPYEFRFGTFIVRRPEQGYVSVSLGEFIDTFKESLDRIENAA